MTTDVVVSDNSRIKRVITEADRCYLNCLKGLLILLVVIGHFGQTISNLLPEKVAYIGHGIIIFIYIFHMPLFLFISGFLSKNAEKRRHKAFADIFIPYLCFQITISICMLIVMKSVDIQNPFVPYMGLWYLLTLFFYRLILPELSSVKGILFISLLISVFTCFISNLGNEFALKKTFGFLVYFLAGYYTSSIRVTVNKVIAFVSLIITCIAVILITKRIDYSLLLSIFTRNATVDSFSHWFYAPLYYSIAFVATSSIGYLTINIVPNHCAFLEKLGRESMAIYLSHLILFMFIGFLVGKDNRYFVITISSICIFFSVIVFSSDVYTRFFNGFLTYVKKGCMKV